MNECSSCSKSGTQTARLTEKSFFGVILFLSFVFWGVFFFIRMVCMWRKDLGWFSFAEGIFGEKCGNIGENRGDSDIFEKTPKCPVIGICLQSSSTGIRVSNHWGTKKCAVFLENHGVGKICRVEKFHQRCFFHWLFSVFFVFLHHKRTFRIFYTWHVYKWIEDSRIYGMFCTNVFVFSSKKP